MNLNAMAAMPMFDSIRSLRSMNHTNLNAQYAKIVCVKFIRQYQQSLKQKVSIQQADKRHAKTRPRFTLLLYSIGTLRGLEQPNCSERTRKALVRSVAIVMGISLFLPMASAVPATIDPKQSAKQFARSQISDKEEYVCLSRLYGKESAWNYKAKNGSHYGIPQGKSIYLKTATAQQQVTWGLNYIHHRYKTPCAAWTHWLKHDWH
jgi:hypothetical protein